MRIRRAKDEGEHRPAPPESDAPPSLNVFLSYRRDDASAYALLLFESLTNRYGNNVFMDIDSLAPGMDFVDAINDTLGRCDILLALVGRGWLTASDADGNARLENPEDFVRLEIEAALARNIRVVPVLVGGALMPRSSRLPGDLAGLARRHAFELSDTRWRTDVAALIRAIEHVPTSPPARSLEPEKTAGTPVPESVERVGLEPASLKEEPVADAPATTTRVKQLERDAEIGAEVPDSTASTLHSLSETPGSEPTAEATIAAPDTLDPPLAASELIDHGRSESSIGQERTAEVEAGAEVGDTGPGEIAAEPLTEADPTIGSPRGTESYEVHIEPVSRSEAIQPVVASSDVQTHGATVKARGKWEYYAVGATALVLIAVIVALSVSLHHGPQTTTTTSSSTTTPQPPASPLVWSQLSSLTGTDSGIPISVSCASSSFCVAVNSGLAYTFDGSRWSQPSSIDSNTTRGFNTVSCPSSSFCMAIDGNGNALTFNGAAWSQPSPISGNGFYGVSCPSSSFCMAVDGHGDALTFNGSIWSQPTTNFDDGGSAVSCPSSSFCMAVTLDGDAVTFDGTTWSRPSKIRKASGLFDGVSCASSSFCVVVSDEGHASTFNGSTWSQPMSIDSHSLNAVSCPSSSFCMAVDNGHALTFNGATWSRPMSIDAKEGGLELSCPSPSFCGAVDFNGRAYSYQ